MEGYVPGEQPRDRRYVKLNTNENPYPPSPQVLEALRRRDRGEPAAVSPPDGRRAARTRGAALSTGAGKRAGRQRIGRAAGDPHARGSRSRRRVAYPVPTYSLYDTLVAIHGGVAIHVPFPLDFSFPRDAGRRGCPPGDRLQSELAVGYADPAATTRPPVSPPGSVGGRRRGVRRFRGRRIAWSCSTRCRTSSFCARCRSPIPWQGCASDWRSARPAWSASSPR